LAFHACLHDAHQAIPAVWRFVGPDGETVQVRGGGRFSPSNGDLLVAAAVADHGVINVPRCLTAAPLAAGRFVPLLTAWRSPPLALHLLSAPGDAAPRKLRVFSDFIVQHFGAGRTPSDRVKDPYGRSG
jgi:DNA-binding transcriptional LysR family regulator